MTNTASNKSGLKRPRRMAREEGSASPLFPGDPLSELFRAPESKNASSKISLLLKMLQQPNGATINQLADATGWLPHTTRAALTGLKKKGYAITSERVEGVRAYRTVVPGSAATHASPDPRPTNKA